MSTLHCPYWFIVSLGHRCSELLHCNGSAWPCSQQQSDWRWCNNANQVCLIFYCTLHQKKRNLLWPSLAFFCTKKDGRIEKIKRQEALLASALATFGHFLSHFLSYKIFSKGSKKAANNALTHFWSLFLTLHSLASCISLINIHLYFIFIYRGETRSQRM